MNLMAFESSGKIASIAICQNGQIMYEAALAGQMTHSQILLPMAEQALNACGLNAQDMDAFAVNQGPGSFTGLRIGICSANALAFAWDRPVIGIQALKALAANVPFFDGLICPLIDARNDQVYAAAYRWTNERIKEVLPPFAGSIYDWLQKIHSEVPILFLGDGAAAQQQIIREKMEKARFAPAHVHNFRAASVAMCALWALPEQWTREVHPFYLRKSQAERLREHHG